MTTSTPPFTARALDVARLTGGDMDVQATDELRSLLRQLASCRMGQLLLRVAVDQRLTVRFAEPGELSTPRGRFGGLYYSGQRLVVVDRCWGRDATLAILAHELQHFVDEVFGWQLGTIQCEVRAYQSEAIAIRQLGLDTTCMGLTPQRTLRHPEDLAAELRDHHLYRTNVEEDLRLDGRVHPLLQCHELLPPALAATVSTGGTGPVGPVGAIRMAAPVHATNAVATGGVTEAAISAFGGDRPTGWDPTVVSDDQSPIGRFLGALDAHRLATGG